MKKDFKYLAKLWKEYNLISDLFIKEMGGTANEVGEFAEQLVAELYDAKQLTASAKSSDLKTKSGQRIQVKSRKLKKLKSESLNVFRSWDFDLLIVVLFSKQGDILKAIEIDAEIAKKLSKYSEHHNGEILTTSKKLLEHKNANNITEKLQEIIDNEVISYNSEKTEKINSNSYFEVELIPSDEKEFKAKLIDVKQAKRTWFYKDGKIEEDIWVANHFQESSNLRANINTNNKVRNRANIGLKKLKIEII